MTANNKHMSDLLAGYLLLMSLVILWGVAWPTMKMVLNEWPIWTFRTVCLSAGGVLLLVLSRLSGNRLSVRREELGPLLLCALFLVAGWQMLSAYGLDMMTAGRSSIVAFTMPVWAMLLSIVILKEPFSHWKALALVLGLSGLGVLIGPQLLTFQEAPVGIFFMLGAAGSWAMGTVLLKKFTWKSSIGVLMGWQLLIASVPVTLTATTLEPLFAPPALSFSALIALIYVLVFPMAYCQWAYFKTVRLLGPSSAAIGTMLIPVVGVFSSALLLGEIVTMQDLLALGLICSALAAVLLPGYIASRRPVRV